MRFPQLIDFQRLTFFARFGKLARLLRHTFAEVFTFLVQLSRVDTPRQTLIACPLITLTLHAYPLVPCRPFAYLMLFPQLSHIEQFQLWCVPFELPA